MIHKEKISLQAGGVAHTCELNALEAEARGSQVQASLGYIMHSRADWTAWQDFVSKHQTKPNQKNMLPLPPAPSLLREQGFI